MPLANSGKAPYGPAEGVTGLIEKFRGQGLAVPFDADVLTRAGISTSLIQRVLSTLKLLDLIDNDGFPTEQLRVLQKVPTPEFKERLTEWIQAVYAPIFQFVDPATATASAIEDAFRVYEPSGQRGRMVTLFAGLCEYAGIVAEAPTKKRGPAKLPHHKDTTQRPQGPRTKDDPPPPPVTAVGHTQVVELRSGGRVTLTVAGNPLSFPAHDREFVFALVDTMNAYRERRMLPAGSPSGQHREVAS